MPGAYDWSIMATQQPIDLYDQVTRDTVLEVRSGRLKKLKGLNVESGIDKSICEGAVNVSTGGIVEDEHDYTVLSSSVEVVKLV